MFLSAALVFLDSSLQTHVLSHWVWEKEALTLEQAIRMLSFVPAYHWGLKGQGLLREGNFADAPRPVCRKAWGFKSPLSHHFQDRAELAKPNIGFAAACRSNRPGPA